MTTQQLTTTNPLTGGYIANFVAHYWPDGRRTSEIGIPASPIVNRQRLGELMATTHEDGRATLWFLGLATPPEWLPGATHEDDDDDWIGRPWVVAAVYASEAAAIHAMQRRAAPPDAGPIREIDLAAYRAAVAALGEDVRAGRLDIGPESMWMTQTVPGSQHGAAIFAALNCGIASMDEAKAAIKAAIGPRPTVGAS